MTIWRYDAHDRLPAYADFFAHACIFCGAELELFSDRSGTIDRVGPETQHWRSANHTDGPLEQTYTLCPLCGWWTTLRSDEHPARRGLMSVQRGAIGSLKDIDTTDVTIPLSDIQRFLLARWDARHTLSWRIIEETVGAVFKAIGYDVRVTNRSGDSGLDVILGNSSSDIVGVQVKRYRKKIVADQIRAFLGALVQATVTRGVFVTTSSYQPKAHDEARWARKRGYLIELVDADSLFDAIGIARLEESAANFLDNIPLNIKMQPLWRSPVL